MKPSFYIGLCILFGITVFSFKTGDLSLSREGILTPHHCAIDHQMTMPDTSEHKMFPYISDQKFDSIFYYNTDFITKGFDFPVGKPHAANYYLALRFGQKNHLGEDWNGRGGGNTDLGDPVYSVADGLVTFTDNICCGWGNVVRVVHRLPNNPDFEYIETVYAHLQHINVRTGDLIRKGQILGAIGTADGSYSAHLHLEMRNFVNMSLGPGYSEDRFGFLNPSGFIHQNRSH